MTILKTQKFDTFASTVSITETIRIIIESNGKCLVETEAITKTGVKTVRRSEITEEMKKIYYPTIRGDYKIYLIRSKDTLRFAKWKNNKLVEKHKWKISDYTEEAK